MTTIQPKGESLPQTCNYRGVLSRADDDVRFARFQWLDPRAADKVERDPLSGCWVWLGASANGYGCVTRGGRMRKAHRHVYELLVGQIPDGLFLDHLCRRPSCVNPEHLEPVTPQVNTARAARLPRPLKTHCPRNHLKVRNRQGRLVCRVCINESNRDHARARAGHTPRTPDERCGTAKGYVRHLRNGEPPCFKCCQADEQKQASRCS